MDVGGDQDPEDRQSHVSTYDLRAKELGPRSWLLANAFWRWESAAGQIQDPTKECQPQSLPMYPRDLHGKTTSNPSTHLELF